MQAPPALLSTEDLYLFNTGQLLRAYRTFGAHPMSYGGADGVRFVVWAPQARSVFVCGDFNDWGHRSPGVKLEAVGTTGVWCGFAPGMAEGDRYKYAIENANGHRVMKADPHAVSAELRPHTASIVARTDRHVWQDGEWMSRREREAPYDRPMLIYEVHLGSWRMDAPERFRTYEELSRELVAYVLEAGYTHIELLPVAEHPLDRSWGYQATGYYAATSRYGPPEGLQTLVDRCHQAGIGVLLDWVPGHFCKDDHGLRLFDGTPQYEPADERLAEKPLWGTLAFDFGKPEVRSFLYSNALFWFDVYHVDGLRVDAVASMIDLHFDKPPEMRTFNRYGGAEHVEALDFLRQLNEHVFRHYPNALMMAEDSSSYPGVTAPTYLGGLGFNYKWNMGWMNDMLRYMETDPSQRSSAHHLTTFSLLYAFSENYVLPLSHDEVVHGKRSLLNKMPGSYEEKFANLRLFYGYWMAHPGKKLLFMGGEFGQFDEWKDFAGLDWDIAGYPLHEKTRLYTKELNAVYARDEALWGQDHAGAGFEWIDVNNAAQCMLAFQRFGKRAASPTVSIGNFSRCSHGAFRIGVTVPGEYRLLLNSDDARFGGSGHPMPGVVRSEPIPMHGKPYSINVPAPSLSLQLWKSVPASDS